MFEIKFAILLFFFARFLPFALGVSAGTKMLIATGDVSMTGLTGLLDRTDFRSCPVGVAELGPGFGLLGWLGVTGEHNVLGASAGSGARPPRGGVRVAIEPTRCKHTLRGSEIK